LRQTQSVAEKNYAATRTTTGAFVGDGPTHDDAEQQAFDAARTVELERAGFLVIRVKERVVRDAPEHMLHWIVQVGELVLEDKFVEAKLRRLDHVPLP
jgi:hypothetical protein